MFDSVRADDSRLRSRGHGASAESAEATPSTGVIPPGTLDFIPIEDFRQPNGSLLEPKLFLKQVRSAQRDSYFTQRSATDTFTHCIAAPVRPDGTRVATPCR